MLNNFFTTKVVLVMVGIILVLLVALAASQVGGIAIRSTGDTNQLTLDASTPALRGVPVIVRWSEGVAAAEVELVWRTASEETFIGRGTINSQAARVTFPCAGQDAGMVLLREITSGEVLGSRAIELLPPTADCLR